MAERQFSTEILIYALSADGWPAEDAWTSWPFVGDSPDSPKTHQLRRLPRVFARVLHRATLRHQIRFDVISESVWDCAVVVKGQKESRFIGNLLQEMRKVGAIQPIEGKRGPGAEWELSKPDEKNND